MASLQCRSTGLYMLAFRFQDKRILRSLETDKESEALRLKSLVEERLKHLREGILRLPAGATADDLWQLVRHGGSVVELPRLIEKVPLSVVADRYLAAYPAGAKEEKTLATETSHLNNLRRVLGDRTPLNAIRAADLREYVNVRLSEDGNRGGKIKPDTVRKELQTFRLAWQFAKGEGYVAGDCPLVHVRLPKKRRRPPFQTWEQIETRVARGGLTDHQIAQLWDCVYLRRAEVASFLDHAWKISRRLPRFPFIYPALYFCAFTGARRSEMFRCQIDDVADGLVNIHEKKRDREYDFSYRSVPIVAELRAVLDDWLAGHPGGQFMFCKNGGQPLDDRTSREAFKAITKNSRWSILRGYHVLRHSFASNLAMKGVDDRIVRKLMGHQSEEMTLRYQHLFPEKQIDAINVLSLCCPIESCQTASVCVT
jgi:site-specific recombinase XerD